ncbi:kinase-like domain-containing protein [Amylostereum chailletii]|nr:kinase-like domain-containing protein [Amylostereum chailletii]
MQDVPALVGTTIDAGRLLLTHLIGSGGFGAVFRAVDLTSPSNSSEYAVKCVKKGSRDRKHYLQEARLHLKTCKHPNVVTLHRLVEDPDMPYLFFVFDLVLGGDLHDVLLSSPPIFYRNDDLVRTVFIQILDAVKHCHDLGVYHRDLKPDNILCSADGSQVFLTDFGLATRAEMSAEFGLGSKYYMSPECLHQDLVLDAYSSPHHDIWSLGLVLANILSGRAPWHCASKADKWFARYIRDPHYLVDGLLIPDDVGALLARALALNPYERLSLDEFRAGILGIKTFFREDVVLESSVIQRVVHAQDMGAAKDEERTPVPKHVARFQENKAAPASPPQCQEVYVYANEFLYPVCLVSESSDLAREDKDTGISLDVNVGLGTYIDLEDGSSFASSSEESGAVTPPNGSDPLLVDVASSRSGSPSRQAAGTPKEGSSVSRIRQTLSRFRMW